jgi:hypothetical protein
MVYHVTQLYTSECPLDNTSEIDVNDKCGSYDCTVALTDGKIAL